MSIEWIDTHAHLNDERFQTDFPAVLDRAVRAGLQHVIVIATTAATSRTCVQLAQQHPLLRATIGIQPNHVAEEPVHAWDEVLTLVDHPEVVALGETGLDRHWDRTPFAQQEDYFARHLALARKLQRPVVIHCREAEADVVRMLREDYEKHGPVRGVMHSFTGDATTAQDCLQMGLLISFAGMLTYKNAQALRDVAARIPLGRVVIETDAPYLAPVPRRGQRNEPAFVVHTAECLAQVLEVSLSDLALHTTRNARNLFMLTSGQ